LKKLRGLWENKKRHAEFISASSAFGQKYFMGT
jgi:hypothetical protein